MGLSPFPGSNEVANVRPRGDHPADYDAAMPSTITLTDGETIDTDEEPQALAERFDAARNDGTLVKVDNDNGSVWVNPHALVTIDSREKPRPRAEFF